MKIDRNEIHEMHKKNVLEILDNNQSNEIIADKIATYICGNISQIIRKERTRNNNNFLTRSRFHGGGNRNETKTNPNRAPRKQQK